MLEVMSKEDAIRRSGLFARDFCDPAHHLIGDFACEHGLMIPRAQAASETLTYSGIGVYSPAMFADVVPGKPERLLTQLTHGTQTRQIGAQIHHGLWTDVGTPERLAQLQ